MGINLRHAVISEAQLKQIFSEPETLDEVLDEFKPHMIQAMRSGQQFDRFIDSECWAELHVLLTGEEVPDDSNGDFDTDNILSRAIVGFKAIPGTETGYGPARYADSRQVKQVSKILEELQLRDLSVKAGAKIHGQPTENFKEDFEQIKRLYATAAKENAVVVAALE